MWCTAEYVNGKIYVIGGSPGSEVYLNSVVSLQIDQPEPPSPSPLSILLKTGEKTQLSVKKNLAANADYIWTAEDESVATVNANGVVTAIGEGLTKITAESPDGAFSEYVFVKVIAQEDDDPRLALDLKVGESAWLFLADSDNIIWESNDENVVAVDQNGKIIAVGKGLTFITAELEGETYMIYVRVR